MHLEQFCTCFRIKRLDYEDERSIANLFHHILIYNVQAGFVDQADVHTLCANSFYRIKRTVQGIAKRNDIPRGAFLGYRIIALISFL